jgi:tetratricopeptide (TPR) repeat protein
VTLQEAFDTAPLDFKNRAHIKSEIGLVFANQGKYEESLEAHTAAHTLDPEDPVYQRNLGRALREVGRYNEAAEVFTRLIDKHPEDIRARFSLGITQFESGAHDDALATLQEAFDTAPLDFKNRAHIKNEMGRVYDAQDNHEEALEAFTAAQTLEPEDPVYQRNMGRTLRSLGRYNDAAEVFTRLIDEHPEDIDARVELAVAQAYDKNHQAALTTLDAALATEPDDAPTLAWIINVKSVVLSNMGQHEESLAAAITASELDPNDMTYQRNVGRGLFDLHRIDEAKAVFTRLLADTPDDVQSHFEMTRIKLAEGNGVAAKQSFKRANGIEKFADDDDSRNALKHVKSELDDAARYF